MDLDEAAGLRARLVERLRARGALRTERVADAMLRVPRHLFLTASLAAAYDDRPLDIGQGQTVSAPHMVAMMAEALDLRPGQRVLEVGAGSGYHAAVVAELASPVSAAMPTGMRVAQPRGKVWSVERFPDLAARARQSLRHAGYGADRVEVVVGDGSEGWPPAAPYDRIYLTCAAPHVPPPLLAQLAPGGKLLAPVGARAEQELVLVEEGAQGRVERRLGPCVFVPLVGRHGFHEAAAR